MADKRRMFRNNGFVVRPTQAPRPVPRVLTQDERRQENVQLMAARGQNLQDEVIEDSEPETTEDEVFFASSGIYTQLLSYVKVDAKKLDNKVDIRMY